jgi:hypothetical protein
MSDPSQVLTVSYLVDSSWQLFKLKWLELLKLQLVGFITMLGAAIGLALVAIFLTAIASSSHLVMAGIVAIIIFIGVVMLLLIASWIQLAQIFAVANSHEDYLRAAWPKAKGMLVVTLLSGLATLGGLILLIIPGIIIWVWFSQSQFVYGLDSLQGAAALSHSRQLIKGRWWKVAGLLMLPSVIMYIISSVISRVIEYSSLPNATGLSAIITTIISLIAGLYIFCYSYQLFIGLEQTQPDQSKALDKS